MTTNSCGARTSLRALVGTAMFASLLSASTAHAQSADAGATATPQPSPTLRLDDGYSWFTATSHEDSRDGTRIDLGYSIHAWLRVFGAAPRESAFLVVFKQGGRELGRMRCTTYSPGTDRDPAFAHLYASDCRDDRVKLRPVGEITAEIRWVDGATDAESVLATRSINVVRVSHHDSIPRPDTYIVSQHGRVMDSVLSWASFTENDSNAFEYFDNGFRGTLMAVSFVHSEIDATGNHALANASMRCQVNGAPYSPPIPRPTNIASVQNFGHYRQYRENPRVAGGTRSDRIEFRYDSVQLPFTSIEMRAHPGRYVCDLRAEGRTMRRWSWTVASNGVPEPHAEQQAGLYLGPRAILVETTIPADTPLDERTNPEEPRRGGFYGRPWVSELARTQAAAVPTIGQAFFPYVPDPLVPAARRALSMNLGGAAAASTTTTSSTTAARPARPRRRR